MPEPAVPVPVAAAIEARLATAVERYGEATVVTKAIALIAGHNEGEDFLLFVGGEHAQGLLNGAPPLYWPELWGTRALLYVWDDSAATAIGAALNNQAWRVREMACRVTATHRLPVSAELRGLLGDEIPRVRAAAARAIGEVGTADDRTPLEPLLKDPEIDVRRGGEQALSRLRDRFRLH